MRTKGGLRWGEYYKRALAICRDGHASGRSARTVLGVVDQRHQAVVGIRDFALEELQLPGPLHGLEACVDLEFLVDRPQVRLHRVQRDHQAVSSLR